VIIAGGGIKYHAKYQEVIKLAELLTHPWLQLQGMEMLFHLVIN
jgi:TPP-dependent trihydroxycyclohexane-1,2-dione (THcHDO) dehydratase